MITSGGRTVIGRRKPRNFNFVNSNHFSEDYIFLQLLVSQLREYKPRIIKSTQQIPLSIVFRLVHNNNNNKKKYLKYSIKHSSDYENNFYFGRNSNSNNWIQKGRLEILFVNRISLNSSVCNGNFFFFFFLKFDLFIYFF